LTAQDRTRLRTIANRIGRRLAEHIRHARPDVGPTEAELLAWCALGVANSVSFHMVSLSEPAFATLLTELIAIPLQAHIKLAPADTTERHPVMAARSRREAI